jgi:hypothetical protein
MILKEYTKNQLPDNIVELIHLYEVVIQLQNLGIKHLL